MQYHIPQVDGVDDISYVKNCFSVNCQSEELIALITFFRSFEIFRNNSTQHALCVYQKNAEYCFFCLMRSTCAGEGPLCPRFYVSISLCVQGSMWQISCRIDPLWLWFYVSRVLCGPGSMWPLMYKLTLCVIGPMCPGSNVTNAIYVQGSMCPW